MGFALLLKGETMKRLGIATILLLCGGCLLSTGCMWTQTGSSEWGWKQETKWAFYQETDHHTEDEEASFEADFKGLVNHLIDLREDEPSE